MRVIDWNARIGRIFDELQALSEDILKTEPPTVAWCVASGAIAGAQNIVRMLRDLGYPGADKTQVHGDLKSAMADVDDMTDLQHAHALWKLLDDISTLDDAARENDAYFRKEAMRIAHRRQEHFESLDGQTLVPSNR